MLCKRKELTQLRLRVCDYLFLNALLVLGSLQAFAVTCNIAAGASVATQLTAITTCAASPGSTVVYAAGSYPGNTTKIVIPATAGTMTITGPIVFPPTAFISGPVPAGSTFFALHTGSVTIQYLDFNGGQPVAGGGGAIYVQSGMNNITLQYNNFHGNQGVNPGNETETLVWFDGTNPGTTDSTISINNNNFGATGDCAFPTASTTTDYYGYCGGIGIKTGMSGLTIQNNTFSTQEEGIKFW
jgi:hypothetical protein